MPIQYPNQKSIKLQKEKSNKENKYTIINIAAFQNAIKTLSSNGFKLWCYINKNQDGYTFGLSKVDVFNWGIGSKSSYDRAVKELIEKGFLVSTDKVDNYIFYELPHNDKKIIITVDKAKEYIQN